MSRWEAEGVSPLNPNPKPWITYAGHVTHVDEEGAVSRWEAEGIVSVVGALLTWSAASPARRGGQPGRAPFPNGSGATLGTSWAESAPVLSHHLGRSASRTQISIVSDGEKVQTLADVIGTSRPVAELIQGKLTQTWSRAALRIVDPGLPC